MIIRLEKNEFENQFITNLIIKLFLLFPCARKKNSNYRTWAEWITFTVQWLIFYFCHWCLCGKTSTITSFELFFILHMTHGETCNKYLLVIAPIKDRVVQLLRGKEHNFLLRIFATYISCGTNLKLFPNNFLQSFWQWINLTFWNGFRVTRTYLADELSCKELVFAHALVSSYISSAHYSRLLDLLWANSLQRPDTIHHKHNNTELLFIFCWVLHTWCRVLSIAEEIPSYHLFSSTYLLVRRVWSEKKLW